MPRSVHSRSGCCLRSWWGAPHTRAQKPDPRLLYLLALGVGGPIGDEPAHDMEMAVVDDRQFGHRRHVWLVRVDRAPVRDPGNVVTVYILPMAHEEVVGLGGHKQVAANRRS